MGKLFNLLTENDVKIIERLVEALDKSTFDFLDLNVGDAELAIGKGTALDNCSRHYEHIPAISKKTTEEKVQADVESSPIETVIEKPDFDIESGIVTIKAPSVGRFYARPEPTAEPFVTVGSKVDIGDTIGLVEVMKLFNAVQTDFAGTISRILVEDGALVEYGQPLMVIEPHERN